MASGRELVRVQAETRTERVPHVLGQMLRRAPFQILLEIGVIAPDRARQGGEIEAVLAHEPEDAGTLRIHRPTLA